jgi:DNA-binding transcriptional LysR family regulator
MVRGGIRIYAGWARRAMAELRHYRYFVEIAKRGTFTAAAEALYMTQSALSEQILQLERECGSQLFRRGRTGVTLTPAGEYLLRQAEDLLAKAAETREGLAGFRHGYRERLRLASVLGPLQSWLPAALADFAQREPHVQIHANYHHGVNEILADLVGDQLDIGVVSLGPSAQARSRHHDLAQRVLMEEELVVLAPPTHSLTQLAFVRQQDLQDTHVITFPTGYNIRTVTEDWFRQAGCTPIVAAESGAIEVMLRLIAAGVGVAIVPRSLAWRALASGSLRGLRMTPDTPPRRVVAAVHRGSGRNTDLVATLIELMEIHAHDAGRAATLSGLELEG